MRYVGPYQPLATPGVSQVVAASTDKHRNAVSHLLDGLISAEAGLKAAIPHVARVVPTGLSETDRRAMEAAYEGRSAAIKRMLEAMRATLPEEHKDLCPFCSMDSNSSLDHFLPQSIYPELCLTPINLVPICGSCNGRKLNAVTSDLGERLFLHPQYDRAATQRLLVARISFGPAIRATYHLQGPANLADHEIQLADRHFAKLALADRFAKRANGYLAALTNRLQRENARRPAILAAIADGLRDSNGIEPVNHWRRAMMAALDADAEPFVTWLESEGWKTG